MPVKTSSEKDHTKMFDTSNLILDRWECTNEQKLAIMGISESVLIQYLQGETSVVLSTDQLQRLHFIDAIDAALRATFTTPKNIYGFMRLHNNNAFFDGRTPLSIISSGDILSLQEVFTRINNISRAQ